jgi:hypothetical protein
MVLNFDQLIYQNQVIQNKHFHLMVMHRDDTFDMQRINVVEQERLFLLQYSFNKKDNK